MNTLSKGLIILMSIILWGCAIHQEPLAVTECKMACTERFEQCKNECVNHCGRCNHAADVSTACRYDDYINEQEVQGTIIFRELNSYRDPLQCRKTTCNCSADFNVCTQSCTGIIQKQLLAKPYCA